MAITTNALTATTPVDQDFRATSVWQINASSADASSCEEIKASPGVGYSLVVKRVIVYVGAAITVTLGENEAANDVAAVLIGPLGGAVGLCVMDFTTSPIVMTANKALTIDSSGAGQVCVYVEGYTKHA
jgi:hypothetical protein